MHAKCGSPPRESWPYRSREWIRALQENRFYSHLRHKQASLFHADIRAPEFRSAYVLYMFSAVFLSRFHAAFRVAVYELSAANRFCLQVAYSSTPVHTPRRRALTRRPHATLAAPRPIRLASTPPMAAQSAHESPSQRAANRTSIRPVTSESARRFSTPDTGRAVSITN